MNSPTLPAEEFLRRVQSAKDILIATHVNPDGDALGSALAVKHWLDDLGVPSEVLCNNPAPYNLEVLPQADCVRQTPSRSGHDLAIVVDLDNFDRLGCVRGTIEAVPNVVLIDHHVPHESPGQLRIVDSSAPATALIILRLFEALGVNLTQQIADCLLAGIVTDTGSFRYRNTTAESLHAAARLLECGANIVQVGEEVYGKRPLHSLELVGRMLGKMHLEMDGRLAWASLSVADFEEFGAEEVHTEGLTNELLSISTVQIAAVLRQPVGKIVRASIRSRGPWDVASVARQFGGGGHRNAAGCTFETDLITAERNLVEGLRKCLESS